MPPAAGPPRASYAATLLVGFLILASWVTSFALQAAAGLLTLPLLFCDKGRDRWHHVQSLIWRSINALFVVVLNPFWTVQVTYFGENPGPANGSVGSVIFCNHRSNADPWCSSYVLMSGCIEARFLYKSSLKNIPFGGWCEQMAGGLAVKFGDKPSITSMLERSKDVLRNGYNVVVFPEGTRSPSGILQDFKPSFFQICAELGAPAVPVCMVGAEKAWPMGGSKVGYCARVLAGVSGPLYASGPNGAEELGRAVADSMCEMAQELLDQGSESEALGDGSEGDPFITGRPYSWWTPPAEIADLPPGEQLRLLKSGKAHERGARLL